MKEKTRKMAEDDLEFQNIVKELIENETVLQMKNYLQHYDTDCFEHCYSTSYYCYLTCKKLNLDYKSAARGAMLHDLFLYDWRVKQNRTGFHAFTHGKTSCENAEKLFKLSKKEKDMIIKHMWPVTPIPPRYKESFILTLVDKYCTIEETIQHFSKKKIQLNT